MLQCFSVFALFALTGFIVKALALYVFWEAFSCLCYHCDFHANVEQQLTEFFSLQF